MGLEAAILQRVAVPPRALHLTVCKSPSDNIGTAFGVAAHPTPHLACLAQRIEHLITDQGVGRSNRSVGASRQSQDQPTGQVKSTSPRSNRKRVALRQKASRARTVDVRGEWRHLDSSVTVDTAAADGQHPRRSISTG